MIPARLMGLTAALLLGCNPSLGDDDTGPPVPDDCADEDLYAASCDEVYCGAPALRVGTGGSDFVPLEDGSEVDVVFGAQGGYHVFLAAEMERLCPIVFLESVTSVVLDGETHELFRQTRHVQAVRPAPQESSRQQYWGIQAMIPCNLYPDDLDHDQPCGTFRSRLGHIEDFELTVTMSAWVSGGRTATATATVQPSCCID